jgi:HEPN domain-containing protein
MVDSLSDEKAATLIQYWADGSKDDLESALSIFSKTERYTASLFFLHLAIEKRLKAAYVKKTKCHAPFTHNLLVLIEKLGWEPTKETLRLAAEINEFNTEARYPDQKLDFHKRATKEFTEGYLSKGKDLLLWIEANSQNA